MPESKLANVVVVLFEPQDPVNIAATVRAMKNMGIGRLRLVNPVAFEPNRIEQIAHGTRDIVERLERFDTLEAALADCVRVAGFTARRRAAKFAIIEPKAAAEQLLDFADDGPVALLFGREDRGLANEQLDLASVVVTIPTTDHASLNLAQAVLIASYELHLAAADATRRLDPPRKRAAAPTAAELEQLFADVHRSLVAIDFLKTRNPEHVMRSIRGLVGRAAPDGREVDLLRAISLEVLRTIDRIQGVFRIQGQRVVRGGAGSAPAPGTDRGGPPPKDTMSG